MNVNRAHPSRWGLPTLVSLVAASLVALSGCVPAPAAAPTAAPPLKMRILVNPGSNSHIPIYVASDAGIFKKNNLDVEIIANSDAIKPMLSGDADVAFPSPTVALSADQQGFKVRIFMTLIDRILQSLMVRSDVATTVKPGTWPDSVRELKGKTLGMTVRGGAVDLNLRYLLQQAGLDPEKDVSIVATGGAAQLLAAMQGDRVDGALAIQPLTAVLGDAGKGKVVLDLSKGEGPETMKQPFITGAATEAYIQQNPEAIRRLVVSLSETAKYIQDRNNQKAVSDIVLKRVYPNLTPAQLVAVVDQLAATTTNLCFGGGSLANISAVLKAQDLLPREVTAAEVIHFDAQQRIGCPSS